MAVNFPNSPANGATVSVGNKTLEYNSTTGTWQIQASNIGAFAVSDTAPSSPVNGDLWFNSASLNLYAYYTDGDSSQWLQVGTDAEEAQQLSATSSDTAPTSPNAGDMWFDTSELNLYIYYNDGNTSQWVQMNSENTDGISDVSDLTDTTNLLFDGQYSSLTGAPTSSTAGALGTLTKTFTQNEEAEITLSENISPVPNVSVFKEVPQGGLTSKGNWDVNANATNYDFFDEKPLNYNTTTLTPSATGDGTFDSSNPISRRHIPASTAATTYATYGAGFSGGMFGLGLYDWGGALLSDDGTKFWMVAKNKGTNSDEAHIYAWTLSTPFRVDTAAAVGSTAIKVITEMPNITALLFNNDGTKIVCANGNNFYQFDLSTAYDLSTMGSGTESNWRIDLQRDPQYIDWSGDGDKLIVTEAWTTGGHSTRVRVFDLNTSYDITTMANLPVGTTTIFDATNPYYSIYSANIYQKGWKISQDGLKFYAIDAANGKTLTKELPSAWVMKTGTVTTGDQGGLGDGNNWLTAAEDDYDLITGNYSNVSWTQNGSAIILFNGPIAPNYLDIIPLPATQVFPSTDVGKKVVGNSGAAVITATSGTYQSVTPFADTSAISSWQLFGAQGKADGSGIELSGYVSGYNHSSLSYDNKSFSFNSEDSIATAIAFNDTGTKMYMAGAANDRIYQYSLSTAYDISTLSYDNISLAQAPHATTSQQEIAFKSDGSVMYISDNSDDSIDIWTVSSGNEYIINQYSYSSTKSLSAISNITNLRSVKFKSDGSKFFALDLDTNTVYEFTMSTAWDVANAQHSSGNIYNFTSDISEGSARSIYVTPDGTELLITGNDQKKIDRFVLSTPWQINTASFTGDRFDYTPVIAPAGSGVISSMITNDTGTKIYLNTSNNDTVFQYNFGGVGSLTSQYIPTLTNSSNGQINSSHWVDIDSMVADETKNDGDVFYAVSTDDRTSWGVIKNGDGVRKIAKNNSGTWQYNNDAGVTVSTGYDLSSISPDNKYWDISHNTGYDYHGIHMGADGYHLYGVNQDDDNIRVWDLTTQWDISSAVYYRYRTSHLTQPRALALSVDGTKMYCSQNTGDTRQYVLSTAWDLTTYSGGTTTAANLGSLDHIVFKPDGTRVWTYYDRIIKEYSISTAWDLTSTVTLVQTVTSTDTTYLNSGAGKTMAWNADGTAFFEAGGNNNLQRVPCSTAWDISTMQSPDQGLALNSLSYSNTAWGSNPAGDIQFGDNGQKLYLYEDNQKWIRQYSTGGTTISYSTSETWVDGTNNNEHATLQEALGAQAFNRMDKAQLQAVTDPNHYVLGDTLDLMIAPYAASGTSPLSDGVTIGYQADALIKQAINGTDYEAEFPTTNKVKIKSLAAQNLKIRII